jgi:hypothetical protein
VIQETYFRYYGLPTAESIEIKFRRRNHQPSAGIL